MYPATECHLVGHAPTRLAQHFTEVSPCLEGHQAFGLQVIDLHAPGLDLRECGLATISEFKRRGRVVVEPDALTGVVESHAFTSSTRRHDRPLPAPALDADRVVCA